MANLNFKFYLLQSSKYSFPSHSPLFKVCYLVGTNSFQSEENVGILIRSNQFLL